MVLLRRRQRRSADGGRRNEVAAETWDSVLAPRNVPHVWAYLGQQPGRMLFAFTPAARIESFFEETSKPDAKVNDPSRFERHGMKLVGPPLLGS